MVAGMYVIRAEDDPATPLATVATLAAVDAALDRISIEVGEQLAANGEGRRARRRSSATGRVEPAAGPGAAPAWPHPPRRNRFA
jgi:hypothetical protein